MKTIIQTVNYEGANDSQLRRDLSDWHKQHPFANGFDWEFEYMWATMTDEDCLAFCLKHPEYISQFKDEK